MSSVFFNSNSDERYIVPSSASMDGYTEFTFMAWFKQTVQDVNNVLLRKVNHKQLKSAAADAAEFQLIVVRATTNGEAITTGGAFSTGSWIFLAATFSETLGPHIYHGGLRSIAVEASYSTQTLGSGTVDDDTGGDTYLGGRENDTNGFGGHIAYAAYFSEALSLNQIRAQQFAPYKTSTMQARWHFGVYGASALTDFSGRGNNGTVNGTLGPIVGDPIPVDLMVTGTNMDIPFPVRVSSTHLDHWRKSNTRRSWEAREILDRRRRQPLDVWS